MTVVHRAASPHSCDMWTTPGKPARASACVSCQNWRRACIRPEWPSATATAIWRADSRCSEYLREDELGRSRIISDLLDPDAEHGQGTKFLEAMLGVFPRNSQTIRRATANRYESDQSNDGALDHDGRPHRHHRGHPFGDGSFLPCIREQAVRPRSAGPQIEGSP